MSLYIAMTFFRQLAQGAENRHTCSKLQVLTMCRAQPCPVTPKNDGSCGGKIHVSAPGVTDESVDEWAMYHASGMSIAVKRHRRILQYLLLIMLMIIGPLHIYNNDFDTAFHLVHESTREWTLHEPLCSAFPSAAPLF